MGVTIVKKASRLFKRELKNRFDGDLNREIAELITNSIDSYERLIKKGLMSQNEPKVVIVRLAKPQRKGKEKNIIQVLDNAEGISRDTLIKIFSERGADNNQGENNVKIRGLFGLGASDCMNASASESKSAEYYSFKDGELTNLRFNLTQDGNDMQITDTIITEERNINALRNKYGIFSKNGTIAIFGIPDSVVLPGNIQDFKYSLETIYLLRNLLSNETNVVYLEAYGEKVRLSSKEYLLQNPFLSKEISFDFRGINFTGKIEFYKNDDKTKNPTDILVQDDRGNIYDNQMFGYGKAQGHEKLSGILTLNNFWNHINYFLEKQIDIVKDDRSGFDTSKKFGKQLVAALSKPIENALTQILKESGNSNISLNRTKNYKEFLKFLNDDLKGDRSIFGHKGDKELTPPANCIEFARDRASITVNHSYDLKLYINKSMLSENKEILISLLGDKTKITATEKIIIKDDDLVNNIITKNVILTGIDKTDLPVVLIASYDNYKSTCDISVIEETIVYPKNGIEFEKHNVTFTPDVNHKKIKLFFDRDKISKDDEIIITNDSNGKLICNDSNLTIDNGKMITNTIGYLTITFSGGDLNDHYSAVASCKKCNDKIEIDINSSIFNPKSTSGDISAYEFDSSGHYTDIKSYYDVSDGKIKIVKGNPINDTFITEYNEEVKNKSLKYIISLVCYQAAKLFAIKEIKNGHIKQTDIETYEQKIESKQRLYYDKWLAIGDNEKTDE